MRRIFAGLLAGIPYVVLGAMTTPDESFFTHAAQGGLSEVENGRLAQERGSSQEVRDFGAMMVKDHSAANEKLESLAQSKAITLPTGPSVSQAAGHEKLKVLSGAAFDKSYMRNQIKAHEETITLFQKEIARGQDGPAKHFATQTLPVLQGHLEKARHIYAGLPH